MSTSTAVPSTSEVSPVAVADKPKTLSSETSQNKLRPWKSSRTSSTALTQRSQAKAKAAGWEARQSDRQKELAVKALERCGLPTLSRALHCTCEGNADRCATQQPVCPCQ